MSLLLTPEQLANDLAVRDLTDPGQGRHVIQLIVDHAVKALVHKWNCETRWCRGERTVTVEDNYDRLGYDAADVTREARYTRYVTKRQLLRSHSTAMVPAALRGLAVSPVDDVLLVCPGVVYRRDSIDRLHTGTPHQLDLWRVTSLARLSTADLNDMVATLVHALLPGMRYRCEPRVHPYTVDGVQIDVERAGEWVEIAECGLAHSHVLAGAGLSDVYSGLALGMGLDRVLMLRKEIPDIRLLRSAAPAVARQMLDLERYRPVSAMPAVRRDISIAVAPDDTAEDLGDRARTALGTDAACLESVDLLSETPCAALPSPALDRLGARLDQKNVLVRIVLRHLERTLSDIDANLLRDRVYAALHQGTNHQWTTSQSDNGSR
ncbi:MAG: hypothetical protein ABW224_04005 [Kibdelosporangium sp.]